MLFGNLSIFDSGVLKSPSKILLLSISFLKSSNIFLMYLGALMLGAYVNNVYVFLMGLPLSLMKCPSRSLMALGLKSDVNIATLAFFSLSICLEYFFLTLH